MTHRNLGHTGHWKSNNGITWPPLPCPPYHSQRPGHSCISEPEIISIPFVVCLGVYQIDWNCPHSISLNFEWSGSKWEIGYCECESGVQCASCACKGYFEWLTECWESHWEASWGKNGPKGATSGTNYSISEQELRMFSTRQSNF